MGHNQPIRKNIRGSAAPPSEIPDKLYFRIGDVARLCKVPAYVLRFWESEFPQLKPNKGGSGQRLYRRRDVEMAMRVKTLLKEEGYTIPGARAVLKSEFRQKEPQLSLLGEAIPKSEAKQLRALRRELEVIAAMLSQPVVRIAGAAKSSKKLQPLTANDDRPSAPGRAARRSSSSAQPGQNAVSPARPSDRTPSGDFLFNARSSGSNPEGDGN
jgi:DNA-binding transcriptional MerR regulator